MKGKAESKKRRETVKQTGRHNRIIEGKAEKPVYLYVTKDGGQIEDARELWGKDTAATQEWLYQRHGKDTRVACIGPAGENLVKYAAIVTGRRTASRCWGTSSRPTGWERKMQWL